MKYNVASIWFAIFFILLAVDFSLQIPQLVNCPAGFLENHPLAADSCSMLTCEDDRNGYMEMGCATWNCMPGKHVRYIEADNSKPYPDCCGRPVCKD